MPNTFVHIHVCKYFGVSSYILSAYPILGELAFLRSYFSKEGLSLRFDRIPPFFLRDSETRADADPPLFFKKEITLAKYDKFDQKL